VNATKSEKALVKRAKELQATANSTSWELADCYAELHEIGWSYRRIAEACEKNKSSVCHFLRCVGRFPRETARPTFWEVYQQVRPDKAVHVSQNTGQPEWYTPAAYVEAARRVLGDIDLDPASSPAAQRTVRATRYFTVKDDGLAQDWQGRVFLNPPYNAGLVDQFVTKLCDHHAAGDVPAAVLLVNNATETEWFQRAAAAAAALCFPDGQMGASNSWTTRATRGARPCKGRPSFTSGRPRWNSSRPSPPSGSARW
jgi:hypothetical protein